MLTLGWSDGNSFIPLCFSLLSSEKSENKIVFVRDRNRSKKWLALLSTDIKLTDEEIVRILKKAIQDVIAPTEEYI